jgi:hypothetical protein
VSPTSHRNFPRSVSVLLDTQVRVFAVWVLVCIRSVRKVMR